MARKLRSGDAADEAEQFSRLFRQHYAQIVAFARWRVGPSACQEIAAETFLVAWRRFDFVPDTPLPWLDQMATFTIANHRRREARTVPFRAGANFDGLTGGSSSVEDDAHHGHLTRAFASLRPKDQEELRLAAWDGLNSAEGAAVPGCSIAAFRVRLHRARGRLARRLTVPEPHPSPAEHSGTTPAPKSTSPPVSELQRSQHDQQGADSI